MFQSLRPLASDLLRWRSMGACLGVGFWCAFLVLCLLSCAVATSQTPSTSSLSAQWARSVVSGTANPNLTDVNNNSFGAVAVDSSGNVYAAGGSAGTSLVFGSGVTAAAAVPDHSNAYLVKYSSGGTPQWVVAPTSASQWTFFRGIGIDGSGNVYVIGEVGDNTAVTLPGNISFTGASPNGNGFLFKVNSSGAVQWVLAATGANTSAGYNFWKLVVDTSGNCYVTGQTNDNSAYGFGGSVSLQNATSNAKSGFLLKVAATGTAQWVATPTQGAQSTSFNNASVDPSGNIYVVASFADTSTYSFGGGVTAAGAASGGNGALIKYGPSGSALWAASIVSGSVASNSNGVVADSTGVVCVGNSSGAGSLGFGNGVSTTGISTYSNGFIVRYNSSGVAQWASATNQGVASSNYWTVAEDSTGKFYVAGGSANVYGTTGGTVGTYDFGNSITVQGTSTSFNPFLVQYGSTGTALWATSITQGTGKVGFTNVSIDSSNSVYISGATTDAGTYGFGNGVTVTGALSSGNVLVVKWK